MRLAAFTTGTVTNPPLVNDAVREILPELLENYQIIHLCGKDKIDESLEGTTTGTVTNPPLEKTTSGFIFFNNFTASEYPFKIRNGSVIVRPFRCG